MENKQDFADLCLWWIWHRRIYGAVISLSIYTQPWWNGISNVRGSIDWRDYYITLPRQHWSYGSALYYNDSKFHGANVGPTWGRQDPGGPHVCHTNLAIWVIKQASPKLCTPPYLVVIDAKILTVINIWVPFQNRGQKDISVKGAHWNYINVDKCWTLLKLDPNKLNQPWTFVETQLDSSIRNNDLIVLHSGEGVVQDVDHMRAVTYV